MPVTYLLSSIAADASSSFAAVSTQSVDPESIKLLRVVGSYDTMFDIPTPS